MPVLLSSGLRAGSSCPSYPCVMKGEHSAVLGKAHPSVFPVNMLINLQREAIIAVWYMPSYYILSVKVNGQLILLYVDAWRHETSHLQ